MAMAVEKVGGSTWDAIASRIRFPFFAIACAVALVACGGGSGGGGDSGGVLVSITPSQAALAPGAQQRFTAMVTGSDNKTVTFTVQEENAGGTITADGSALIYSTYLGGSNRDAANAIAVDAAGNAYVTGFTQSNDFPLARPIQQQFAGSIGSANAFVTKLDATGTTAIYSMYLGGSGDQFRAITNGDFGTGIAANIGGSAYIVGTTSSSDSPIVNAAQPTRNGGTDLFVAKIGNEPAT